MSIANPPRGSSHSISWTWMIAICIVSWIAAYRRQSRTSEGLVGCWRRSSVLSRLGVVIAAWRPNSDPCGLKIREFLRAFA